MIDVDKSYNADNLDIMQKIDDESIDCILTDPPYLYLKHHKLDTAFNEVEFFTECYRVLKKGSFLVFFGRGISVARWITICDNLGFVFKEEIVWKKPQGTTIFNSICRTHEMIYIFSKSHKVLNTVYVDKIDRDIADGEHSRLAKDVRRFISALKNPRHYTAILNFLRTRKLKFNTFQKLSPELQNTAVVESFWEADRGQSTLKSYLVGVKPRSIINCKPDADRIHETQKPIELIQILLELTTAEGDTVLDPFAGSGSTAVASINLNRRYIMIEQDEIYFKKQIDRIEQRKKEDKNGLYD